MSEDKSQSSKGKLKYFNTPKVHHQCQSCEDVSKEFNLYKDAAEKRHNTLLDIMGEHKVLLDRILGQNSVAKNIMGIFPIASEEQLKELDTILIKQKDTYIRHMKSLLAGNAERNLHLVLGQQIILQFNVDGSFGKKRLRDYGNVSAAMIDAISTFSDSSDKTLRAVFQRQKKKYFKQTSRTQTSTPKND